MVRSDNLSLLQFWALENLCLQGDSDAYNLKKRLVERHRDIQRPKFSLSGVQGALKTLTKYGLLEMRTDMARRGDKERKIYTPTKTALVYYFSRQLISPSVDDLNHIPERKLIIHTGRALTGQELILGTTFVYSKTEMAQIAFYHGHKMPDVLGQWKKFVDKGVDDIARKVLAKMKVPRYSALAGGYIYADPEQHFYKVAATGTQELGGEKVLVEKVLTDREAERWRKFIQNDHELSRKYPSVQAGPETTLVHNNLS